MVSTDFSTILITGANGYIGRVFARFLQESHPESTVILTSRTPSNSLPNFIAAELTNPDETAALLKRVRPDVIFHLAGGARSRDWDTLIRGNVETTRTLAFAIQGTGLECRLVLSGSAAEYGTVNSPGTTLSESDPVRPLSPYGLVKSWQTDLGPFFHRQGLDVVSTRIFNLIGSDIPRYTAIGNFVWQIGRIRQGLQDPVIKVGKLNSLRDFLDTRDACEGLYQTALKARSGEVYNICSGRTLTMREVIEELLRASGITLDVKLEEYPLNFPLEEIHESRGDPSRTLKEIGWKVTTSIQESALRSMRDLAESEH